MIEALVVGQLYSNEEIFRSLSVSNAGGIRLSQQGKAVLRAVIMTSVQGFHGAGENPYHDRLEGGILTYTAAGKLGQQTLAGANNRLIEQKTFNFPIHGFVLVASRRDKSVGPKRWKYLGLLEYLRHYPDTQLDTDGKVRKVWLFEFKIHDEQQVLPLAIAAAISSQILIASRLRIVSNSDLLVHCGFSDVCVTRLSADGGGEVYARAVTRIWVFGNTFQVQAKRWLHSVGRKEVAGVRACSPLPGYLYT